MTSWPQKPDQEDAYERDYSAPVNKGSVTIANYGLAVVLIEDAARGKRPES